MAYTATGTLVAEDVMFQTVYAVDVAAGRSLQASLSPRGNVSTLIRNDLGALYMYYYTAGALWCVGYAANIPLAPMSIANFGYANTAYVVPPAGNNAPPANHWRLTAGQYLLGAYTDGATGALLSLQDTSFMSDTLTFTSFTAGAAIPASVFAVPPGCPTTPLRALPALRADEEAAADAALRAAACDGSASLGDRMAALQRYVDDHNRRAVGHPDAHVIALTPRLVARLTDGRACAPGGELAPLHTLTAPAGAHALPRYTPPSGSPTPPAADARPYAPPVRDQGGCGGCWSFASAAATEVVANVAVGARTNNSAAEWYAPQYLLDCVGPYANFTPVPILAKGCLGGWPATALLNINATGIPRESTYLYAAVTGATCDVVPGSAAYPLADVQGIAPGDADGIAAAVAQYGAVTAIIQTLPDFSMYAGGIYSNPACRSGVLDHAVTIVGYGTSPSGSPYWIVKNSFGRAWGVGGYFYMARGVDMCGIEDWALVPVPAGGN